MSRRDDQGLSRRDFLKAAGISLVAAACAPGAAPTTTARPAPATTAAGATTTAGVTTTAVAAATEPATSFVEPAVALSGDLRILLWSHFVPAHDVWFDGFVQEWGEQVGVNVTVDHVDVGSVPAAIASEIQAGEGHDLMHYIAVLSQHEPSVVDMTDVVEEATSRYGEMLDLTRRSSFNPNTGKFYAYAPAWVPDPGDYRKSLWEAAGFPNGPSTWDELLEGGSKIKAEQGIQMGIGLSEEIDSSMAARALLWSFGASIQDENENVVFNSPETLAAFEYMVELFNGAMTPEVFAWNAASNNQGLIAGELSFILNSISAYRTAQEQVPDVAEDIFFVQALEGPATALAAQHVMYNWIIPDRANVNVDAAKEFLLHYTENLAPAAWHSKLYDFPGFPERVPDLNAWLDNDPFGSQPADKLAVLKTALDWATNIGHPGSANPAVGEIFNSRIVEVALAKAARGDLTPQAAIDEAEGQINSIFDNWRAQGLVGGGA